MTEHEQASTQEAIAELPRQNPQGSGVWYFVEHKDAKVDECSFRLAVEAQALAKKLGAATTAPVGAQVAAAATISSARGDSPRWSASVANDCFLGLKGR